MYGWRGRIGLLVPSINTTMETEVPALLREREIQTLRAEIDALQKREAELDRGIVAWRARSRRVRTESMAAEAGMELIVYRNPEAERLGINPFDHGSDHTDIWKTEGLKQALDLYGFDAAFGGAFARAERGGQPIGRITDIDLNQSAQAVVTMEIDDDLAPLHSGTRATIELAKRRAAPPR